MLDFGCVCLTRSNPLCDHTDSLGSGTDRFGDYKETVQDFGDVKRHIRVYPEWTSIQLKFPPMPLNWMSPAEFTEPMSLGVPQDNDLLALYEFEGVIGSSYVTQLGEFTVGFIDHRTWKTGFTAALGGTRAVVGLNGLRTRDVYPHGYVYTPESPRLAITSSLDAYARLCGAFEGAPPAAPKYRGWNSWAVTKHGSLRLETFIAASKESPHGASIIRDAVYDLNASSTREWLDVVNTNEQSAGVYLAPFAEFGSPENITCGGETWSLLETVLTYAGSPVRPLSNPRGYIRDPTHPSTRCLLEAVPSGYSTFKVDFLNYAAYEGDRHNMTLAPTGLAAYNYALYMLNEALPPGARVEFAISPPLPAGPRAHARRAGCDQMFGYVRYTMDQYRGGWWLGELYAQHPDLVTFTGGSGGMDALARVAKAIVFSGVYESGDDFSNATTAATARRYLDHPGLTAMWNRSGYFTRVDSGVWARDPTEGPGGTPNGVTTDVVVFNYGYTEQTFSYNCTDVFNGGRWSGIVSAESAAIVRCEM